MEREKLLQRIPAPLLSWYDSHKRSLPWRENPTPYRVWVSEIMLQQTRVEAVREYYLRFMKELPTVEALAACEEEKLLKLWEGLGYYNRVRNMQKAAQILVEENKGEVPAQFDDLIKLPGIGKYTAGAISSIAFGIPVPAVDGNVLRVVMRLMGCEADVAAQSTKRSVTDALRKIYPIGEQASDLTEGLMELGEKLFRL